MQPYALDESLKKIEKPIKTANKKMPGWAQERKRNYCSSILS